MVIAPTLFFALIGYALKKKKQYDTFLREKASEVFKIN